MSANGCVNDAITVEIKGKHIDNQRLRNLTTGLLHTEIQHVYLDIEYIVGSEGIMTHHLPAANRALRQYMIERLDRRFWDDKYDPSHEGETWVKQMNADEKGEFFLRFSTELNNARSNSYAKAEN